MDYRRILKFVEKINFNPTELEKRKMRLIYSGIYPLKDILHSVREKNHMKVNFMKDTIVIGMI